MDTPPKERLTREQMDAEWQQLKREALDLVREMVGAGISKGRAVPTSTGQMLITKPAPEDAPGTVFRLTSVPRDGTPSGHMEVSKSQWREFLGNQALYRLSELGELFDQAQAMLRPDLTQGVTGLVLDEPTEFRYRLKYRELDIGTAPAGFIRADGRELVYSRPLTYEELRRYEIEPLGATVKPSVPQPNQQQRAEAMLRPPHRSALVAGAPEMLPSP